jgi:hypothetical protein
MRKLTIADQDAETSGVEKSNMRSRDVVDYSTEADRVVWAPP